MHTYKSNSPKWVFWIFGLSFPTNKCLLDDFIKSSPWCNVPKECTFKESSLMISDFDGHTNGHKISKPI